MVKYEKENYFETQFEKKFDGIITDPPYKNFGNKLGGDTMSFEEFMNKAYTETVPDAFLITFCNQKAMIDLINGCGKWNFKTFQIWDKRPTRTWIHWSYPLRCTEFILYFTKGKFKLSFKNGTVKEAYKRSSFGGVLKDTTKNDRKVSYGMYEEIVSFRNPRNKKHPTEKPKEFSKMFKHIVGNCNVLDPFCGTGNLLSEFENSTGIDMNYDSR